MKSAGLAILAVIFLAFSSAYAENFSLPLGGYFHPGRAMPVKWDISDTRDIKLTSVNAITTNLVGVNKQHGIAAWIAIDSSVETLHWQSSSGNSGDISQLHALNESDGLIGSTVEDDGNFASLFPNRRMILVHLNAEDLKSPALAWETLDAISLTSDQLQKISPTTRQEWLCEGITLVIKGNAQPDEYLHWKQSNGYWIASAELPLPPIICAEAYAPTESWAAGRSPAFRRQIFFFGVIYCLVFSGISLLKSRWMPVYLLTISIAAIVVASVGNLPESPAIGVINLTGRTDMQDKWIFQKTQCPNNFLMPVSGLVHPIFSDAAQVQSTKLQMDCDSSGKPFEISGYLPADQPLVIMSRQIGKSQEEIAQGQTITSPLRLLVQQSIYPGFTITGQSSPSTAEIIWPTLFLARQ